jgi:hypothetical protein
MNHQLMNHQLLQRWGILAFSIALTFTATPKSALSEKAPTLPSTSLQPIGFWNDAPGEVKAQGKNEGKDKPKDQVSVHPAIAQATVTRLLSNANKPLEQPRVYRTTVEGDYAIASWLWGEAGGQTILAKKQGRWKVLRSGGGAVDVGTLKSAGIPEKAARALIQKNATAYNNSIKKPLRNGE